MIDVIDYRPGNAPSVVYALEHLGLPCRLVEHARGVGPAERMILPGVGAARATLASLADQELVDALAGAGPRRRRAVPRHLHRAAGAVRPQRRGRHAVPRLGARARCGVSPTTAGSPRSAGTRCGSRVSTRSPAGCPTSGHFYFVNSYYCAPDRPADVLGVTEYGAEFCSVVAAATSSPRSSTPRRAARSGSRSCAASRMGRASC